MIIENQTFDEERALYGLKDLTVKNCRFDGPADGESAFKECRNIDVTGCFMNLRYPFWHVEKAKITDTSFTENCRAALWYDKDILIENSRLGGIKALRECKNISLKNCSVNSPEFAWKSQKLTIENVTIEESEYPFFEIRDAKISGLKMKGKYSFQYDENIEISDSELNTKDAFWHTKNVTVKNSLVKGEYLGWYSENLTLINCRIIGTQPFCYCKNLVLKNCTMEDCDLAFERSTVEVEVSGKIDSIKNPLAGKITADFIGQIILEEEICDKSKTQIICKE
ncbi:Protein of unknown function [Treponema bryantii]|uniref:DUF3737 domain-containing protein n=1 Tax=Treponema bryantii TaxID=163 RepID=A0A1I3N0K4_9SPIR|nr:DUF3737 family protein [Treponema bryantii]SFJ02793.1 Protein of unknown function [Treponema bryantii]